MNAIARPTIVLLAICVVISVSLAFTYALTKDGIEANGQNEANRARSEVFPGAAFETVFKMGDAEVAAVAKYPVVTELCTATPEGDGADVAGGAEGNGAGSGGSGIGNSSGSLATALGYVANVLTYGYGGKMEVIVGIAADGTVMGVRVIRHSETPGLGANATNPEFYWQFTGKPASPRLDVARGAAASDSEIAAISGATVTSRAVTEAVNAAAEAAAAYK